MPSAPEAAVCRSLGQIEGRAGGVGCEGTLNILGNFLLEQKDNFWLLNEVNYIISKVLIHLCKDVSLNGQHMLELLLLKMCLYIRYSVHNDFLTGL